MEGLTSIFVFQQKLPCPQATVDCRELLTVYVQVVITLPEVPSLLHLPNGVSFPILDKDGAIDEVEGPTNLEDDLTTYRQHWCDRH